MDDAQQAPLDVWLVEDSRAYRRGLAKTLEREASTECGGQFESSEELFVALGETTRLPDVVLLDVQLPGMDGLSALDRLRRKHATIRTVVLTAFDDDDKIFRAVCAGACGYLLKSAGREEIVAAIHEAAEGGAPMTPSVARRVLDRFAASQAPAADSPDYALTVRERDILRLMADGLIKKEIADRLEISQHTVSTHMRSIYEKLHVNTNTGAVAKALREDLI